MKEYSPQSLYNYGMWLLGQREYSEHQIREKMKPKCENTEFITQAIEKLKTDGYLSDERKAQSIVYQYFEREKGIKIMQRFRKAGLSAEIIEKVLPQQTSEDKREDALNLVQKKFKTYDADKHEKYMRFLLSRGFDYSSVKDTLKAFKNPE